MKKKIAVGIVLLFLLSIILFVASTMIYLFLSGAKFSLGILGNKSIWSIWLIGIFSIVILQIVNYRIRESKGILKENYLEDSHWLKKREMRSNGITITSLKKLHNVSDGIPIYAHKNSFADDINIYLAKAIHTLVVGATGCGKTTAFVDPTIQILARCKTKPCMVITDPKGELYETHSKSLESFGYKIQLIDLKDIYQSTKWNPFAEILRKTEEIIENTGILGSQKIIINKGKYYFQDYEYLTYEEAEKTQCIYVQELNDSINSDLQDIIYTICPIGTGNEATWQEGARDLILALALAFWEDVRDGYMQPKQFILFNLYKNISNYLNGEMQEFKDYFDNRDDESRTRGLSNTVLITESRTLTSYLTDVNKYFSWMADTGICALTSENEIEIDSFDEAPTALFLRIPDEKMNRHKIVTLFITQMYKALVAKADLNEKLGRSEKAELLRNVYFIMDEFGNLPKFHMLDRIVTVGRSRRAFLIPIIQDFPQLENVYGKDVAHIVKSNCNIKMFIGSSDKGTINEFSELCGKKKVRSISYSEHKDTSVSLQAQERPLIYPNQLMSLNDPPHKMGNAIVLPLGKSPLRALFTPMFKASKIYAVKKGGLQRREASIFKESEYYYDITLRSKFLKELAQLSLNENEIWDSAVSEISIQNDEIKKDPKEISLKRIHERIRTLSSKISAPLLDTLLNASISEKISLLDNMIDEAIDNRNGFLKFELCLVKLFIINESNLIFDSKTGGEK